MADSRLLTRVVLKNYKSIAACDVAMPALLFLVGPNGAGKSNFLDALRFIADALRSSLDLALRDRGGIKEVRRRSAGHPTHFGMRLEFRLTDGRFGHYSLRIGAQRAGGYEVQQEECRLRAPGGSEAWFRVCPERVESSAASPPAHAADRLYLVNASGLPEFRAVYDALSRMGFYNLSPDRIRDLQPADQGEILARDGGNIASVVAQLARHGDIKSRIEEYLSRAVPGVHGVHAKAIGPKETLEFRQSVSGVQDPWRFLAANMSDGTLRALGVLVALFQSGGNGKGRIPLVAIEEPEIALHPAATGVLLDALREAARGTQILVTSHSPDLLDDERLPADAICAVEAADGITRIARMDEAGRSALGDRLYTAGELLRLAQIQPDPNAVVDPDARQLRLFDDEAGE